ncbi:hypothetical protein PGB90_000878 [Kerria lacca]
MGLKDTVEGEVWNNIVLMKLRLNIALQLKGVVFVPKFIVLLLFPRATNFQRSRDFAKPLCAHCREIITEVAFFSGAQQLCSNCADSHFERATRARWLNIEIQILSLTRLNTKICLKSGIDRRLPFISKRNANCIFIFKQDNEIGTILNIKYSVFIVLLFVGKIVTKPKPFVDTSINEYVTELGVRTEWSKKENERGNLNEAVEFILSIARDVGMAEDSNERDGIRLCWSKESCKEEFHTVFTCRCPEWSYCRSPGRYYNAYCSIVETGYIWAQNDKNNFTYA